jgi:hypothetical protein
MRFPRGKYKGRSIAEVEMIDPGYIRWCRENTPWMLEQAKPKQLVDEDGNSYIPPYKDLPIIDLKDAF